MIVKGGLTCIESEYIEGREAEGFWREELVNWPKGKPVEEAWELFESGDLK
jgi:hypothetical protein